MAASVLESRVKVQTVEDLETLLSFWNVVGGDSDQRDAQLMLLAQRWRFRGLGVITRYPISSGDMVDCRGGMARDLV